MAAPLYLQILLNIHMPNLWHLSVMFSGFAFFPGGSFPVRNAAWYGILEGFHTNDSDTAQAALT